MNKLLIVGFVVVAVVAVFLVVRDSGDVPVVDYDPVVDPAEFTTVIDNPYFSLPAGKRMVYEAQTDEGLERTEILIPGWTRNIEGVETLVFWDRVYLNDELIEDTRDYLAQHTATGDVWYFGEHVDNYENGQIANHDGAWLTGVDGAKPGIWALGNPRVGDQYRNEYYRGEAEDVSDVVALGETVTVPFGTVADCVQNLDGSPLFFEKAYRYDCGDERVHGTALEVDFPNYPELTEQERVELVAVDMRGALGQELPDAYQAEGVVAVK